MSASTFQPFYGGRLTICVSCQAEGSELKATAWPHKPGFDCLNRVNRKRGKEPANHPS